MRKRRIKKVGHTTYVLLKKKCFCVCVRVILQISLVKYIASIDCVFFKINI